LAPDSDSTKPIWYPGKEDPTYLALLDESGLDWLPGKIKDLELTDDISEGSTGESGVDTLAQTSPNQSRVDWEGSVGSGDNSTGWESRGDCDSKAAKRSNHGGEVLHVVDCVFVGSGFVGMWLVEKILLWMLQYCKKEKLSAMDGSFMLIDGASKWLMP